MIAANSALAVATAAVFVWLGMVLAISFVEAPLKFRAPGVTVPIGLGIGRLVFRALNGCEVTLGALVTVLFIARTPEAGTVTAGSVAMAALVAQVVLVRPHLSRRTAEVLAGADAPRSRAHLMYIALEVIKVIALIVTGTRLLSS